MASLQVVIAAGCFGCSEAVRIFHEVREQVPSVPAELIDLSLEPARKPQEVVAVPSYLIDGKLAFTGNPSVQRLVDELLANGGG